MVNYLQCKLLGATYIERSKNMKVRKFDRYVEHLKGCINTIENAKNSGILLTDMERLDYYFKKSLLTGKISSKDDIGFLGAFYAEYLEELYDLRAVGYSNKEAIEFLKRVCFRGRIRGISRIKVSGYDKNGVLYVTVKNYNSKDECTLEVTGLKSFTQVSIALITLVATDGLLEGEFKLFAENYLINTYKEISEAKDPEPYVYQGISKSFRSYMSRSTRNGECGNIIQFRLG